MMMTVKYYFNLLIIEIWEYFIAIIYLQLLTHLGKDKCS